MPAFNISRRRFLTQTGLGFFTLASLPRSLSAMMMQYNGSMLMPMLTRDKPSADFKPDVELNLICKPDDVAILQGKPTRVMRYIAELIKGDKSVLTNIPHSYLGAIIRLQKGQKVRINLHNSLAVPTVTHWHGLHVSAEMDGHPQYAIPTGGNLVYEFEVTNRASMNIYHPHPHDDTARQVYYGLAGALIVNDEEEAALELPSGAYEIPIVLQDKQFDANNQLIYANSMPQRMFGFYGDQILVNGQANFHLDVDSRAYRMRFLNGSTARIYKLGWNDGTPLTVIGVDGGLLAQPETKPYVMLAPGERVDMWVDFSGRNVGTQLTLRSLPFSGALPRMGMMHTRGNLPMGSDYPLFTVRVTRKVSDSPQLPKHLSKMPRYTINDANNPDNPMSIAISEGHGSMLLNGRPYAFNDAQAGERVKLGTIQVIDIHHAHGGGHGGMGRGMGGGMGMMMSMAHPIHLHGQSFSIVSRNSESNNDTVNEGFIDSGLKDTVLVMPNQSVRIIKPFHDFKGLFMFHCHNLEHEDMGMMREFLIE